MSEMIERVARALCAADDLNWEEQADPQTSGSGDNNQAAYLHAARAAIEAMRDPTDAMIAAGIAQANICTDDQTASAACVPEHAWPAMIDAALAVSESTDRSSINVPNQENQPS